MTVIEDLKEQLENRSVILFVGAGVSAGLGLPTYTDLMKHIAKELNYDFPILDLLASDYLQIAEYYHLEKETLGPLKSWMDRSWDNPPNPIESSMIHKMITQLNFPMIYTTNYDRMLERSFEHHGREFNKIATVKDLVHINHDATQIIKFHGDFDEIDSIVLTESHYFERLNFESPMDLKLRADCLGKALLFIGYGLNDINIRLILYKLNQLWKESKFASLKPTSYFFSPKPNDIQEKILLSRGIKYISNSELDSTKSLETFLNSLI